MDPRAPETSADADGEVEHRSATGMPRWVKVSLIVVGVLVAAFLILKVAGVGGEHGPGRHLGPGSGGQAPSGETEHRPPAGVPNHGG